MIKIKLTPLQLNTLNWIYSVAIQDFDPKTPHELLCFEHLSELGLKLRQMEAKGQSKYQLPLKASEATAFMQTWTTMIPVHRSPVSQTSINNIIGQIDQYSKRVRHDASGRNRIH